MADWLSRSIEIHDDEGDAEIDIISTPVGCVQQLPAEVQERQAYSTEPYLPTWEQWLEASLEIPSADKDYVSKHANGLWYSRPGNKLYVPNCLYEPILYYFHAGSFGGHFGISKNYRRLSRWFYWPKQKVSVAEYIRSCLPCKRTGPPTRKYLRQVLEKTEPFQLISLDHVGPRSWNGQKLYYLVIIDHFSRFVIAKPTLGTAADETIKVLHEEWVMRFGAPEAVLADRGRAFVSKAFQSYVCGYLAADLVYAGAGYPQGNAINESVHRGFEASITARKQYDATTDYEEVLADVVLAYNSTPHSATGQSPYYLLFGKEMILSGLQKYCEDLPELQRLARIREARKVAMLRAIMGKDEGLRPYKPEKLEVGDQVVYYLRPLERERIEKEGEMLLVKYSPQWSVPTSVARVANNTVNVTTAGGKTITIAQRLIRIIGKNAPPSLQYLTKGGVLHEPAKLRTRPIWETEEASRKRARVQESQKVEEQEG